MLKVIHFMKIAACIFETLYCHFTINYHSEIKIITQIKMLSYNLTKFFHKKSLSIPATLAESTFKNIYCPEYRLLFTPWKEIRNTQCSALDVVIHAPCIWIVAATHGKSSQGWHHGSFPSGTF